MNHESDYELPYDHRTDLGRSDEPELERRLLDERPVPSGGFRGGLGRMLAASDPGFGPRPPRLRLSVAAWLGAGLIVLGIGALEALASL